jgi:hypothetical protein
MLRSCAPLLLVAVAAGGCGGQPQMGPPTAIIGTGVFAFVPIADGDRVPIIHGPQGGHHIWGSVRARNVDPSALRARFTLFDGASGSVVNTVDGVIDLSPIGSEATLAEPAPPGGPDGWGEYLGSFVYVPNPCTIDERAVRMRVDVTDDSGRTCGDEHRFIATCRGACQCPLPERAMPDFTE